jgi:hypothetical protein
MERGDSRKHNAVLSFALRPPQMSRDSSEGNLCPGKITDFLTKEEINKCCAMLKPIVQSTMD